MSADLALDTAVQPIAGSPGRYAANITGAWIYRLPSGGVLMTVALRAIEAEIGDASFRPVSATATFCSPVPVGPAECRVDVLRRGNAAIQARSALSPAGGALGLEVCATFARDREGPELRAVRPPDVPSPAAAPGFVELSRRTGHPRWPFFSNFESRLARGQRFWEPGAWTRDEARFDRWLRYLVPQRRADGALDPLALPPIADTMPPALTVGLGPEVPPLHAPSLDLTVHFLDPVRAEWLLVSSRARHARAGYASAEVEIWSEDGRLAAYGTQTMFLRRMGP
ncbi:MAG: thioesterase family protein [Polyangiaceae bacterium]|nr:thioesterase family protein [Polyangiaceae bacterium]